MSEETPPPQDPPETPGEDSGELRRGYLLRGRVQGVGFRWWTARQARRLGLVGSVRNRPDGRVELHVAGPAAEVARLERLLREGPPSARVRDVEEIPPRDGFPSEFRIER